MNLITTTELRTKTKMLIESLLSGEEIFLIHRSKIIGTFKPEVAKHAKVFDAKKFESIVKKLNLPRLSHKARELRYREAMDQKHGKGLS